MLLKTNHFVLQRFFEKHIPVHCLIPHQIHKRGFPFSPSPAVLSPYRGRQISDSALWNLYQHSRSACIYGFARIRLSSSMWCVFGIIAADYNDIMLWSPSVPGKLVFLWPKYNRLRIKIPPCKTKFQTLEAYNSKIKCSRTKLTWIKYA